MFVGPLATPKDCCITMTKCCTVINIVQNTGVLRTLSEQGLKRPDKNTTNSYAAFVVT